MDYLKRIALCTLLILAPAAILLHAQEPRIGGAGAARGGTDKVGASGASAAAIAGSKEDPAAVERGGKLFVTSCAGCHGPTASRNAPASQSDVEADVG